MSKTLSSNIGYNGGSPRIRHENSTIKVQPKEPFNTNDYINKIKNNYLLHNLNEQNLDYLINYFTIFISDQKYSGEKNNNNIIYNCINLIETLYTNGEINTNIIQIIINQIIDIKNNIIPPPIISKSIKTEGTTNTINNYDGNTVNITRKKVEIPLEKNEVSPLDLESITDVIKKYYYNDNVTKTQIENLNNSFKVLSGDSIKLTTLPNFLSKINTLVENAVADGRMSQNRLSLLMTYIQNIIDSEKPIIIKKEKVVKSKLSTFSPYYNK